MGILSEDELTPKASAWIPCSERLPVEGAKVGFIVKSENEYYHGKILGGTYQGNFGGYHAFSVPGIEFEGSHWFPLPSPPEAG